MLFLNACRIVLGRAIFSGALLVAGIAPNNAVLAQTAELAVPGQNLFVNRIAAVQTLYPAFDGRGIRLSIKEFRFDSNDVDFRGRLAPSPYAAANLTTHANIMATLAGGAGNTDLAGRGAAPGCSLVSSSFVGLFPDPDYQNLAVSVQNHSYGVDIQPWYGERGAAYDQSVVHYPPLLHVFSAGNKGQLMADSGIYAGIAGFANLTGEFKMAKNTLLAGATDSTGNVWALSSRGPAYDGRLKPDLTAFGQDGSSGAAALVSGAAAVLQQTLRELDDTLPEADLVRALLLVSTDEVAPPGPDYHSGFGNLNLKKALETCLQRHYFRAGIASDETLVFPLVVPPALRRLRIAMAWTDPPAAAYAAQALVNDLDIRLFDPAGQEYRPLVLSGIPHPDSLVMPARPGRDSLNNVEQIYLDFPQGGLWELRISAAQLHSTQSFAIAWQQESRQHFEWIYPLKNDPCPAGEPVILRWENTFDDSLALLRWKPVSAAEWLPVQDSVSLQNGGMRWQMPDQFGRIQLQMQIGNQVFTSDTLLVAARIRLETGFDCPDSLMLFWNKVHPEAEYQLFGLGDRYLAPLFVLPDTFVVLPKNLFPQPRFAVSAFQNGIQGPRSPAPDIREQGVSCYFRQFFAVKNDDKGVDLRLEIGTPYGLNNIQWEKWQNGAYIPLFEEPADGTSYEYQDEHPQAGANTYRVRLQRENGTSVYSEAQTVFLPGADNWFVFPNPASSNDVLQVLTQTVEDATFRLFNLPGQTVLEQALPGEQIFIPLEGLAVGVYVYVIEVNGEPLGHGKLFIH
jgi:hypothetical protein